MSLRAFVVISLLFAGNAFAGSISGHVTVAGGGPLAGARVNVCYDVGNCRASTTTAADGSYRFDDLLETTHYVVASKTPYITQYYNGVECTLCVAITTPATPIAVPASGEVANVDIALRLGGTISGVVRRATDNSPIHDFVVTLEGPLGYARAGTINGQYTTGGLPEGDYHVYTARQQTYINQVYPDIPCLTSRLCKPEEIAQGQIIHVTAGENVGGIDFIAHEYTTISGTITKSDGTPVAFKNVSFADNTNGQYYNNSTNGSGQYVRAIPPGTYVVSVAAGDGYSGVSSAPVPIAATPVTGIDLVAPVTYAKVKGTIRDRNGNLFANAHVALVHGTYGTEAASTTTDASGHYEIILPNSGRYYFKAIDELLPHVDCDISCSLTGATPFDLAPGSTTTIDMQVLSERTVYSGKATKGASDGPPVKLDSIAVFDGNNGSVRLLDWAFQSKADGTYTLSFISRNPSFHIVARAPGVIPTEPPNAPWYCEYGVYCPTVPPVPSGVRPNTNFVMMPYGTIRGTVTEKGSGKPVPLAPVNFSRNGARVKQVRANAQGQYEWTEAYGAYQVWVPEWLDDHYAGQVYPDKDCSGRCNDSVGALVNVATGGATDGIDFHLTVLRAGTISGTVKDSSTGLPVAGAPVHFAQNGVDRATVVTSANGYFQWTLADGSYNLYVPQFGTDAYWGQVYPGKDCNGVCNPSAGTVVTATFGVTKYGIDFHLTPTLQNGRITGTVVDDETGAGIANVIVKAMKSGASESATTDAHGVYRIDPLPSGDYTVTAELAPYFPSLYGNGALVRVTAPNPTTGIDFRLRRMQITSISPSSGALAGGTWITILGTNFPNDVKVRIGDAEAEVVSVTPTMIVAITPAGTAGLANVTLFTSSSATATMPKGFVYTAGSAKRRSARH